MQTYTITEKQNAQSKRDGFTIEANDLSDVKRKASKMQCFQGTVLEISDESGALSIKKDGKWIDEWTQSKNILHKSGALREQFAYTIADDEDIEAIAQEIEKIVRL